MGPYRVRRVLPAGTLGPTLLVGEDAGAPALVAKLITTVAEEDLEPLAAALTTRAEAQPAHPGLVPIADVGIDGGAVYVVAAFVDAPALETRLRGGRQPLVQVLEWLAPVAAGLDAAHAHGCLHGAVHPRDVLLPRGRGTLTGLDVSPALEALGLQAPVRVPFTAPERASGRPWDARADQYSLAMLALDALSGRRLIAGTIPAFDRWTLADTPGEDARLHEVFARALHPDPAARFPTVAAWLEALTGAAEPGTDLSRFTREGVIPPPQPSPRRSRDADIADEALPLALFPAEEPEVDPERTVAAPAHHPRPSRSGDAAAAADADPPPPSGADGPSPTGEWLVAAMNDDLPPLADTGPLPIQSLDEAAEPAPADRPPSPPPPEPPSRAAAAVPDDSGADDFSFRDDEAADADDADMRAFDLERGADDVRTSADEDEQRWTQAFVPETEDSGRWRTGLVIAAAALLLALVAFGTWRSLMRDEAPAAGLGAEQTGAAPDATSDQPAVVDESPLSPSAEDVAEGAPPPAETPPESAPPVASSDGAIAPAPAEPPQTTSASPTAAVPSPPSATGSPSAGASAPAAAAGAGGETPGSAAAGEAPLSLDRARVLIRSSPSGQVRINGQLRGQTPLVLRDLPFGSYVISISRAGYVDAVREVDMLPSQPVASIAVDLERVAAAGTGPASQSPPSAPVAPRGATSPAPAPETGVGSLYVVSHPADARLSIDGRAYGTAPAVVPGLAAGRHHVRVEYPGYRVWVGTAEVRPGQRVRIDATLVQEPR